MNTLIGTAMEIASGLCMIEPISRESGPRATPHKSNVKEGRMGFEREGRRMKRARENMNDGRRRRELHIIQDIALCETGMFSVERTASCSDCFSL